LREENPKGKIAGGKGEQKKKAEFSILKGKRYYLNTNPMRKKGSKGRRS